jgi:hypothetical protein
MNQREASLVYCLALKMYAKCSSEISVEFQRTTCRYIPEDKTVVCIATFVDICSHILYHEELPILQGM